MIQTLPVTRRELEELIEVIGIGPEVARDSGETRAPETSSDKAGATAVNIRQILMTPDLRKLASLIDHTLLRPETSRARVEEFCEEATSLEFATACVNQVWVPLVAERLRGTRVRVATVAGFPLGAG
jgi:hypothetical protein